MPDGTIRYACIGCGSIANNYHLPALARIEAAQFVVACDIDEERARATGDRWDAPEIATDWELIVERDDLDLICVFTKVDAHAEITVAAANAGRHVFVQKPFARTVAEGQAMVEAAHVAGVRMVPSFMHRYFDESLKAAELVREGAVGEIEFIRQRNATRNPRQTAPGYGGALMDIGAHGIDLVRAISGSEITRVCSRLDDPGVSPDKVREERDLRGGEVNAFMLYELESGAAVSHEVQWSQAAGASRFQTEIYGTHGTILLRSPLTEADLAVHSTPDAEDPLDESIDWRTPELPGREMGAAQHEALIEALLTGEDGAQTADDGLAVLRVCEAARQSAVCDRWEDVFE